MISIRLLCRTLVVFAAATLCTGCGVVTSGEADTLSLNNNGNSASGIQYSCLATDFRDWYLHDDGDSLIVGGQAFLPTPLWRATIHKVSAGTDKKVTRLVLETIEPELTGIQVFSWVGFESEFTPDSNESDKVVVHCADEVVWESASSED